MTKAEVGETRNLKFWFGVSAIGVVSSAFVGFMIFSSVCPCALIPGGMLFGESVETPISNWNSTTANQENLCQLQIWAGIRPHSINLNCMATPEGELFLSCSVCDRKYWAARVEARAEGGPTWSRAYLQHPSKGLSNTCQRMPCYRVSIGSYSGRSYCR